MAGRPHCSVSGQAELAAQSGWTVLSGERRGRGFARNDSWGCASEGREGGLVLHEVTTGRTAHTAWAGGRGGHQGRCTYVHIHGRRSVGGLRGKLSAQSRKSLT